MLDQNAILIQFEGNTPYLLRVKASVGSRPNFRGRLIAEIFERLIDHGRPIEGKLKEKYNKKKRMKIGEEMAE